jgi:hypothetical protein
MFGVLLLGLRNRALALSALTVHRRPKERACSVEFADFNRPSKLMRI